MRSKIRFAGNIITIIALALLLRKFTKIKIDWNGLTNWEFGRRILFSTMLYAAMLITCSIAWMKLVEVFSGEIERIETNKSIFTYVFLKSNILKYIPGNIFQFVGRNEVAILIDLKHTDIALATLAEITILICIAIIGTSVSTFNNFVDLICSNLQQKIGIFMLLLIIFFLIFVALCKKKDQIYTYFKQVKERIHSNYARKNILFSILIYFLAFVVHITIFILVLDDNIWFSSDSIRIIAGSYFLSWVAGYITPGAPGGIGVREFLMMSIVASSGFVSENAIMQASVVFRLVTIIGDLIAFAGFTLLMGIIKKRKYLQEKNDNLL